MKCPSLYSVGLLLPAAQLATCDISQECTDLADHLAGTLKDTTVKSSDYVRAGTNLSIPQTAPTCSGFRGVVNFDFCRVQMIATTGSNSSVKLETWLPTEWSGRFLSTGNGGLGGCISYSDMAYTAQRGFAAVGTNNGHDGDTGVFFLNNPGVIEDFAYRAVHTGVLLGKQTTAAYYGKNHTKSYYLGCSTGGRQGFMEAQKFPNDFDGIIAGAPAFDFTGLQARSGSYYNITGPPGSPTFVSSEPWGLVLKDVFKQCDDLDGLVDGILEDPDLCQYRPESLICAANQTDNCLTSIQVETVREAMGPLYGKDGKLVYPRLQPGIDASFILWNGKPFNYAIDWWRYVIYNNPDYDGNLTLDDIAAAQRDEPFGIDAFQGDLSGIKDRGSKILHYHGLADPLISSDNSARYYNLVSRTMGLTSNELDDFYRYFRISGMGHCSGGPGAFAIGNQAPGFAGEDPEKNVLWAIVKWVEEGEAPNDVLGTAFTDASKQQVKFERRHCKYPKRNMYMGKGDPNLADSWECII